MNLLGAYTNGNYRVMLFDDGTKIRTNQLDHFSPEFPESIDMKISDRCDRSCPMCHEQSSPAGALANLNHPLLDSIPPYTELALGGGNILEHPGLTAFLGRMEEQKVVCNATFHADHFLGHFSEIQAMVCSGLLHGVGVSVNKPASSALLAGLSGIPNAVVHVIAGVADKATIDSLCGHGLKVLILGYKTYGRGEMYRKERDSTISKNIAYLKDHFDDLSRWFSLASFDNLALKQLDVQHKVSKETWDRSYMGDDGSFTMYVDLVKEQYAISSVSPRHDIDSNNIKSLFQSVRMEAAT